MSLPILVYITLDFGLDILDFLHCMCVLFLAMNCIAAGIFVLSGCLAVLDVLTQATKSTIFFTLSQFELFCSQTL
jgi:hypothetical protein